jgi:predicted Zn-dependent protease with MMP-like domain
MRFERLHSVATSVVKSALLALPQEIRDEAAECRIEFCEMDALVDIDEELDPDLLGLFEGNARCDPLPESPDEMPRIRLFLDNLWDECKVISPPTAMRCASPSSTNWGIISDWMKTK